jgi:hypothetical protein
MPMPSSRWVEVPAEACPWCGFIVSFDGAMSIKIDRDMADPTEGDVMQCVRCGEGVMISPDGLRKATEAEFKDALRKGEMNA